MMFITGPLYSGKRTFARKFRGSVIADVQDAAAELQTPEQLEALARELAGTPEMLKRRTEALRESGDMQAAEEYAQLLSP